MKSGCRKWMIAFMYHVCCTFFLWVCGVYSTSLKYMDADYTSYLGIDYKKENNKPKRTSTIVSNHTCWLDVVALIKTIRPAFSPSAEFRNLPMLGNLIDALDSIYIPRGGSEEKKAKALAAIRQRQELIEETGKYQPFLIFAEGGTSNGTGIISFKKGAFFAEKTVRPIFVKYGYHTLNPAFDTIEFLPLLILTLSWGFYNFEVTVLPDFTPNEFLFEQHADKGQERWEIYAWAVRDAIIKGGKF
jgi:1-acyl-sn-glycerol-3-phosphate acyltransferase